MTKVPMPEGFNIMLSKTNSELLSLACWISDIFHSSITRECQESCEPLLPSSFSLCQEQLTSAYGSKSSHKAWNKEILLNLTMKSWQHTQNHTIKLKDILIHTIILISNL